MEALTGPAAVREFPAGDLPGLAERIREFLVAKVCRTGGHLGANLGVVELTIALHRVFDSPRDALVFDTGHQSYVHKILTGRAGEFAGLRQAGGIAGYPSRAESGHDWVENSHASTALSYADGIAKAVQLTTGPDEPARRVVAVIGDGAMTGGLAWEGLNNLGGAPDRPVIVVLNDNGRSYDPTIGGLARHLSGLRSADGHRAYFEELGFAYVGPVDGHDVAELEEALREAAAMWRPVVVHAVTAKGHGYRHAEADDADRMHACGVIDPVTGQPDAPGRPSWTHVFADEIAEVGADVPGVVCLTAAMLQPVGLKKFATRYPERVFDVGIAEQHAVCSAAGLAMGGLHPVVCVYATFLNRAFDQVLMDVALHGLGVTFVLDRAGVTGPDGPSHHGMWDTSMLAMVPGLRMAAPRDPARLRELLREAVGESSAPTVIRFPKATAGADLPAVARMDGIDILHRGGRLPLDVLLVATGVTAEAAVEAASQLSTEGIGVTVVDPRWILPVHPTVVHLADRHQLVVTAEDGVVSGGAGSAIAQACMAAGVRTPVHNLGLPAQFLAHGERPDILRQCGLDAHGIATTISRLVLASPAGEIVPSGRIA
ncbi:1-deoxy-D-xylulose-5-phosphate synthase [Longispora albida]|uniref:1-deoxy-D-xylulose-5-phosphate synthase n=1 Tax=Longispora albida TaxID=203523 RepID=UPI001B7FDBAA